MELSCNWGCLGNPVHKWPSSDEDLGLVWRKLVERLSEDEVVLTAIVMRNICLKRNKFVFDKVFPSLDILFTKARINIAGYKQVQCRQGRNVERT